MDTSAMRTNGPFVFNHGPRYSRRLPIKASVPSGGIPGADPGCDIDGGISGYSIIYTPWYQLSYEKNSHPGYGGRGTRCFTLKYRYWYKVSFKDIFPKFPSLFQSFVTVCEKQLSLDSCWILLYNTAEFRFRVQIHRFPLTFSDWKMKHTLVMVYHIVINMGNLADPKLLLGNEPISVEKIIRGFFMIISLLSVTNGHSVYSGSRTDSPTETEYPGVAPFQDLNPGKLKWNYLYTISFSSVAYVWVL
jgi:hypothetical protein